jgi:hypothetical protein
MSTDGTWEMLQREDIDCHQYDTDGMFSEVLMQKEIKRTLDRLNPDWVLYMGCDLFFHMPAYKLDRAMSNYYNCIYFKFLSAKYTGEERVKPFDPFHNFTHVMQHQNLKFLFKWNPDIQFNGDSIVIPNETCYQSNNIVINYGDTKPKMQRFETLQRREKAWNTGENTGLGEHFRHGLECNYQWNKGELINARQTEYWKQIEQIRTDAGLT